MTKIMVMVKASKVLKAQWMGDLSSSKFDPELTMTFYGKVEFGFIMYVNGKSLEKLICENCLRQSRYTYKT